MKSSFLKPVLEKLGEAKCTLVRHNHSHLVYRTQDGKNIVVPRKLENYRLACSIVAQTHLKL
jgi:predicted RNA binding protein YcfA (HicA-like mRNA interferase family)